MAQFIPSLKVPADLNRFCLALGLGFTGAVFAANMGMGAGGAFLLSLIVGVVASLLGVDAIGFFTLAFLAQP
jgi:hypothetical protein